MYLIGDGTTTIPEAKLGNVLGVDMATNLVEAGNIRAEEEVENSYEKLDFRRSHTGSTNTKNQHIHPEPEGSVSAML